MISLEDNSCAVCKVDKKAHDNLLARFGWVSYPVPPKPLTTWSDSDLDSPVDNPSHSCEVRVCREFVPVMQIFDRDGTNVFDQTLP